jgi:hypothetical protein
MVELLTLCCTGLILRLFNSVEFWLVLILTCFTTWLLEAFWRYVEDLISPRFSDLLRGRVRLNRQIVHQQIAEKRKKDPVLSYEAAAEQCHDPTMKLIELSQSSRQAAVHTTGGLESKDRASLHDVVSLKNLVRFEAQRNAIMIFRKLANLTAATKNQQLDNSMSVTMSEKDEHMSRHSSQQNPAVRASNSSTVVSIRAAGTLLSSQLSASNVSHYSNKTTRD